MRTLQIVNIVCAVTIADQELFIFVFTMPPKNKLKRPDNQGLISNLFKSSTQDKPFNPVSSQTLPGPESDKQPVTNVTEPDSTQIVENVTLVFKMSHWFWIMKGHCRIEKNSFPVTVSVYRCTPNRYCVKYNIYELSSILSVNCLQNACRWTVLIPCWEGVPILTTCTFELKQII